MTNESIARAAGAEVSARVFLVVVVVTLSSESLRKNVIRDLKDLKQIQTYTLNEIQVLQDI